jgi:hypothetical protein
MQPRNEMFSPLFRQRPNAVERAAILPDVVAPRERWAKLAKWMTADSRASPPRSAPKDPRPSGSRRRSKQVADSGRLTTSPAVQVPRTQIILICAPQLKLTPGFAAAPRRRLGGLSESTVHYIP